MSESKEDNSSGDNEGPLIRKRQPILAALKKLSIPSVIDDDDPDGLLPTGTQNNPLPVYVPERWPNYAIAGEEDILELYWARPNRAASLVQEVQLPGPITEDMFPYPLAVPTNLLQPDGRFEVWYEVVISAGGPGAPSEHRFVTFDTEAPSYDKQPGALLFPTNLPGAIITDEYLLDNNDEVEFRVPLPLYTGADDGDVLELFWSSSNPPTGSSVSTKTILRAEIDAGDIRVALSGDDIRAANQNGTFYAVYKLRDRAGNETLTFSRPAIGTVSLITWPGRLPPPNVPLHGDDNLVHRADARAQVRAVVNNIPPPLLPNDQIQLVWDGVSLPPQNAVLPLNIPVPWNVLIANGPGPAVVRVGYKFIRGGSSRASEEADINIDFTVAGQDHPNAPALLNPLLPLIDIVGGSGVPNVLLPGDRTSPVIPKLKLYQLPNPGEVLELYWGQYSGAVATYTVQAGDVEGAEVSFTAVSWDVIDTEPNNTRLPVYYTTSNGVNEQQSENTYVRVQVTTIDDLPEPVFEDADAFGYIGCEDKPWEGIRVRIEFDSGHFAENDEVRVFWQGYQAFNSSEPIVETYGEFPEVINAGHVRDGFIDVWILPFDPHIKPVTRGSWGTYYTLTKSDGQFGTSPAPENLKIIETVSEEQCAVLKHET
jgi:hypothetical protein